MSAYKPYLKLKPRSRRKIQKAETPDGEYFFSEDVADSPCEAAFYIIPHQSESMFKVGWSVAADRRLDKINEIWGNQLDIYSALVIATSRDAALHAERTMKLILGHHGWKINDLPPLEGYSEFYSTDGLLYAHEACINQLLPMMRALEARTHLITARGADESSTQMFDRIAKSRSGKSVSPDKLLVKMITSRLRKADIPAIISSITWNSYPESIIAAFSDSLNSKYSAYASHSNELWMKCGVELLKQPALFMKVASEHGITRDDNLINLLKFLNSNNVIIKDQDSELITAILSSASARTMVELTVSHGFDLRRLTFSQRTKVFEKIFQEKNAEALLKTFSTQLDDLDQLRDEAAALRTIRSSFSHIDLLLYNPHLIEQIRTPKNFPAVLAFLYFIYFDGLSKKTAIPAPYWPGHEQVHFETLKTALASLNNNSNSPRNHHSNDPVPVFQKALIVAMLDLYSNYLKKDAATYESIIKEITEIGCTELAQHFEPKNSVNFSLIRQELRKSHQLLASTINRDSFSHVNAALQTNISQLKAYLPLSEEGRYYAMYAFQDIVAEFGVWVTAPSNQAEKETRSAIIKYIKSIWSLICKELIHNHYIFNHLLLFLHAWAIEFELDDVPPGHPQAVR